MKKTYIVVKRYMSDIHALYVLFHMMGVKTCN